MTISIPDLQAFLAVVDAGSIGRAAMRIHLTQPGVTRRVQNLEEALGVALLDRSLKPPRATPQGKVVYELGQQVLRSVGHLVEAVAPEAEPAGDFRLGVSSGLGDLALAEPIDRLRAAYPKLCLRAPTSWSLRLVQQVQSGLLDAAAVFLMEKSDLLPGLAGERIGTQTGMVIAPLDSPLRGRITLKALARYPWVVNQDGCSFRRVLSRAFESKGLVLETAAESALSELQISLVARGIGLAMVTPRMLSGSLFRARVRILDVVGFRPVLPAWLVHQRHLGKLTGPLACFREALAEALAADQSLAADLTA